MEHHHINELSAWNYKTRLPYCEIWQHRSNFTVAEAYPI